MKTIKVAILSDLHCGSLVGLTPPEWQGSVDLASRDTRKKLAHIQNEGWKLYTGAMKRHKPHVCICNGDAIDGKGERSGGCEQITTDMNEQADMAYECLAATKASRYFIVRGTPYHTGKAEQFEDSLAKALNTRAHDHPQIKVGGLIIDAKHKVGASSVPHGRHTAISREAMWNILWAEHEGVEKADVIVRSHVHYYNCIDMFWGSRRKVCMTTPALQWRGTRYGKQQCSGTVDFGAVFLYITGDEVRVVPEIMQIPMGYDPLIRCEL